MFFTLILFQVLEEAIGAADSILSGLDLRIIPMEVRIRF